jgi:glycosyltransferase involved in cell wall biosynthesis
MNIAFLVERPTQFEAPFYRFAARDPEHELRVLFTGREVAEPVFDPELGRPVTWGIDLLGGYPHEVCPRENAEAWLAERLRPGQCDLLIANGYIQPLYRRAARVARKAGIATALRLDSVLWATASYSRNLAKRLLFDLYMKRTYDLFLGTGSLTLDYLRAFGVPKERAGLFPYAVDVEGFAGRSRLSPAERAAFRERLGVPAGARVVLGLAKFNGREAPWDLLRAFFEIRETDVWLVLAGDGPDRAALESQAARLERVRFPGYVPYPDLPALYAASNLFVHPAREERWGVSVQEALACGLPVVASSRVGAGYDLVEVGGNGYVYPAGDAGMLAHRIGEALALDPARVRERSAGILSRWDYAATWRNLLAAAATVHRSRS